jgi:hypothetical protein
MGGRKQMRESQMTVQQFKQMLKANRDRLFYFWRYATEQRRNTATSVSSSTIKAAMQRRKAK